MISRRSLFLVFISLPFIIPVTLSLIVTAIILRFALPLLYPKYLPSVVRRRLYNFAVWWHTPASSNKIDPYLIIGEELKHNDDEESNNCSFCIPPEIRKKRLTNGASAHMLLGSLPEEKGKTNEIIHIIFKFDSLQGVALNFLNKNHNNNNSNNQSAASDDDNVDECLDVVKCAMFDSLIKYRHFSSVPYVYVPASSLFLTAKTHWKKIVFDEAIRNHHIKTYKIKNQQEFDEIFAKQLLNERLKRDRPLWDIHLFALDEENNNTDNTLKNNPLIFLLRTHHAIADGLTLMHVIASMFEDSLHATVSSPASLGTAKNKINTRNQSTFFSRVAAFTKKIMPIVFDIPKIIEDVKTVLTASATKDTTTRLFDHEKFELRNDRNILYLESISLTKLNEFKEKLKNELNLERIPTNEIMHALVSNAWNRCAAADANEKNPPAPPPPPVTRFLVPFSLPVDPVILSTPRYRHELLPRNYIGFLTAAAAAASPSTSSLNERIRASSSQWSEIKTKSYIGHITLILSEYIVPFLPLRMKQAGCWDLASSESLVFSSVPGPMFGASNTIPPSANDRDISSPPSSKNSSAEPTFPFAVEYVRGCMANGMPQLVCIGCVDKISLTLTFNGKVFPATWELQKYWRDELIEAGIL